MLLLPAQTHSHSLSHLLLDSINIHHNCWITIGKRSSPTIVLGKCQWPHWCTGNLLLSISIAWSSHRGAFTFSTSAQGYRHRKVGSERLRYAYRDQAYLCPNCHSKMVTEVYPFMDLRPTIIFYHECMHALFP